MRVRAIVVLLVLGSLVAGSLPARASVQDAAPVLLPPPHRVRAADGAPPGESTSSPTELPHADLEQRRAAARDHFRARRQPAVPGELLVTTDSGASLLALKGATGPLAALDAEAVPLGERVVAVRVPHGREAEAATALRARAGVIAVERSQVRQPARVPDDARYPEQWAHQLTSAERAWELSTGSPDVTVAVIDTGVAGDHAELAGSLVGQAAVTADGSVREVAAGDNDRCRLGHGTMVAGIVGAAGGNGVGVTGVSWSVGILDIAVTQPDVAPGCDGISDAAVIAGVRYAVDHGADVVNLSLGGPDEACPTAVQQTVDSARAAGVLVVASSGNSELEQPGVTEVPASCDGVVSVGALARSGGPARYSTTNAHVDLAAPGGDLEDGLVLTTSIDGGYEATQGTSFSSPYVAGAAALLLSIDPALDPDGLEAVMEATAVDAGEAGRDAVFGHGALDLGAAAEAVAADSAPAAPEADPGFPVGGEGGGFGQPDPPEIARVAEGTGTTEAVRQAVAVSQALFRDGAAEHAVLARRDDYADALAGSSLAFGVGPLLFTSPAGPLTPETRGELQRTLAPGSVVYLLGGEAALPPTLESELADLGYSPVRLAGSVREATASVIADEVRQVTRSSGLTYLDITILATSGNWVDAVAAGSMGALFGMPILLTGVGELHPEARADLEQAQPSFLYVVGGTAAVPDPVGVAAVEAAGLTLDDAARLGGGERNETVIDVAAELEFLVHEILDQAPPFVLAVNVRRADGYAHVLSASAVSGARAAVMVPVDGEDGGNLTEVARRYVRGFGIDAVLMGDVDLVTDVTGDALRAELSAPPPV